MASKFKSSGSAVAFSPQRSKCRSGNGPGKIVKGICNYCNRVHLPPLFDPWAVIKSSNRSLHMMIVERFFQNSASTGALGAGAVTSLYNSYQVSVCFLNVEMYFQKYFQRY